MKITGIIWLEDIVEKLWSKHDVDQHEVKEVLDNTPYSRFVEKGNREGENVYSALGQTDSGHYLIVFFIYKKDRQALIVAVDRHLLHRVCYRRRGMYLPPAQ